MIRHSIEASAILSDDERATLEGFFNDVANRLQYVEASEPRLIHGDPEHRNTLWDNNNVQGAVLCDWESAVFSPVEWDLVTIEVHCRRFGFGPEEYQRFCHCTDATFGTGLATRPSRTCALRMITTNARKSPRGTPQAAEVHRRIAQLGVESEFKVVHPLSTMSSRGQPTSVNGVLLSAPARRSSRRLGS
jgi:hypothetical protein